MLTYTNETYEQFKISCELLRQLHYLEVAAPRGAQYGLADDFYEECGENLRIVVAYDEDLPVGYHMALVSDNIMDDSRLLAQSVMYFMQSEYRKGRNGIELLKVAQIDLTAFAPGATWRASCPIDGPRDFGVILERSLAMKPTERVYEKRLDDAELD